jgi:hypothetical protein
MLRNAHTSMYMLLNLLSFATFFLASVCEMERTFPTLPVAASVCSCLSYYFLNIKCLVRNTVFC